MDTIKVVTAREMARLEAISIKEGMNSADYMNQAGRGIAEWIESLIVEHDLDRQVVLLVGKGNNGGDAFRAGRILLKEKYRVRAYVMHSESEGSELNIYHRKKFIKHGGEVCPIASVEDLEIFPNELIVDGLLGTGFNGECKGLLREVIEYVNAKKVPVLSIDIPSGLSGDTGLLGKTSICSSYTAYLGQPKLGFFINEGYSVVGYLKSIDFGLEDHYVDAMQTEAFLVEKSALISLLPPIHKTRHKYQAGYVIGITGSKKMPGAAMLSSLATLRGGAGMVRVYTPEDGGHYLLAAEVIHDRWNKEAIIQEMHRAKSLYIGPGMGRDEEAKKLVFDMLKVSKIPMVIDADALYHIAQCDLSEYKQPMILTPHRRECLHLLGLNKDIKDQELMKAIREYVSHNRSILILKGAPTFIFRPDQPPFIILCGDPGMATAGSGDVLTGILAALLAQGLNMEQAALLGVALHGTAGEQAAEDKTSYSIIASDLIDYLHEAFTHLTKYPHIRDTSQ